MEKQKKFSLKNYLYEYKWWYVFGIAIFALCRSGKYLYSAVYRRYNWRTDKMKRWQKAGIPMMLMKILIAGLIMMFWPFLDGATVFFGASRKIEYRLRNDMFGHLETLSARYF